MKGDVIDNLNGEDGFLREFKVQIPSKEGVSRLTGSWHFAFFKHFAILLPDGGEILRTIGIETYGIGNFFPLRIKVEIIRNSKREISFFRQFCVQEPAEEFIASAYGFWRRNNGLAVSDGLCLNSRAAITMERHRIVFGSPFGVKSNASIQGQGEQSGINEIRV